MLLPKPPKIPLVGLGCGAPNRPVSGGCCVAFPFAAGGRLNMLPLKPPNPVPLGCWLGALLFKFAKGLLNPVLEPNGLKLKFEEGTPLPAPKANGVDVL